MLRVPELPRKPAPAWPRNGNRYDFRPLGSALRATHPLADGRQLSGGTDEPRKRCGFALSAGTAAAGNADAELSEGIIESFDMSQDSHMRIV